MSKLLSKEQLAEIERRAEAATEGPWYDEDRSGFVVVAKDESGCNDNVICQFWRKSDETDCQDAPNNRLFITHARTDIPALLAHCQALETDLRDAMKWIADIEEREAAVCPEDVPFDEHIRALEVERERLAGDSANLHQSWAKAVERNDELRTQPHEAEAERSRYREALNAIVIKKYDNWAFGEVVGLAKRTIESLPERQTWCDHCSADLNGVKHILCDKDYQLFAKALYDVEKFRERAIEAVRTRFGRGGLLSHAWNRSDAEFDAAVAAAPTSALEDELVVLLQSLPVVSEQGETTSE